MKVLLISANTTHTPHPVYPLGLDYLMGALTPRHEVRILDINTIGGAEPLSAALRGFGSDVIGLSIRNIDFELDILGELLRKGILHEQCPFYTGLFLGGHPMKNQYLQAAQDKRIEVQYDGNRKAKPFSIISGDCPG